MLIYGELDPRTEAAMAELFERVDKLRAESRERRRALPVGGRRTNEAGWSDFLGHLADDLATALGIDLDEDEQ